ncbi:zinc-ribbon domain-containing protein [Ligilactobacillus salivarius]|uniref:zinc-ribbon domain-containing protein n=1 Tax=Ligilactobacillus salivarius TaxID=1624 RepID=UPI00263AEFE5|nr:zinc-ribbon domain-containing protein [Ligilactobacillus salivarius]MDN4847595.1 zinc-ribbon domain-containing protein [Ligilactobacillus salivarius]
MEKKFCTNCGSQVNEGAKFCPNCGNSIGSTNDSETRQKKFCTNCGSQLNEGSKFCSNCGNSIASINTQRTTSGQRQSGSNNGNPFNQIQDYYEQTKEEYGNLTDQELGFVGSVKYALVHWNDFKGVESRKSVYWWLLLGMTVIGLGVYFLVSIIAVLLSNVPALDVIGTFIVCVAYIAIVVMMLIAELSAVVRRMRYLNVQNIAMWMILTFVIPPIWLYTFIYLMLIDDPINNQK